jgi:hypothetical protein
MRLTRNVTENKQVSHFLPGMLLINKTLSYFQANAMVSRRPWGRMPCAGNCFWSANRRWRYGQGPTSLYLIVQEHAEEAAVDRQRAAVVGHKAKPLELIHEMAHS